MKSKSAAKGKTESKKSTTTKPTTKNNNMATTNKKAAGKETAEVSAKDKLVLLPPSMLIPNSENPRIRYREIEELMNSILENGVKDPLTGYYKGDKVILKDGHRRMKAIQMALDKGNQIARVPVIIVEAPSKEQETLDYILHNDGDPLNMLEQSEVVKRLMNFGWKPADISRRTGKKPGYIANLIILTKVPMKIYNLIVEDKISAHAVIQIVAALKGDEKAIIEAVEEAIKAAGAAGKSKATPKHVKTEKVKAQSFGKFYKWLEEIVDTISGRKSSKKEKEKVVADMLVFFENGQRPKDVAESYFIDKTIKEDAPVKEDAKKVQPKAEPKKEAPKKAAPKKAQVKKSAVKVTAKKAPKKAAKKK